MSDWMIGCEVLPGIIRHLRGCSLRDAKVTACSLAEGYWKLYGNSQYIVILDTDYNCCWAVRYTPENGGTYHVPEDHQ